MSFENYLNVGQILISIALITVVLLQAKGSGFGAGSDFDFAEPDLALFRDSMAGAAIRAAVDEAFRQGIAGYAQDAHVQGRPWPVTTALT